MHGVQHFAKVQRSAAQPSADQPSTGQPGTAQHTTGQHNRAHHCGAVWCRPTRTSKASRGLSLTRSPARARRRLRQAGVGQGDCGVVLATRARVVTASFPNAAVLFVSFCWPSLWSRPYLGGWDSPKTTGPAEKQPLEVLRREIFIGEIGRSQ